MDFRTRLAGVLVAGVIALVAGQSSTFAQCEQALIEADAGMPSDLLGRSVSIDGDRLVAGAPGVDDTETSDGAAYVFRFEGGEWVEDAQLLADTPNADANLGFDVSLSGDNALIGAVTDQDTNGVNTGAAYIFRRDDNGTPGDPGDDLWLQQARMLGIQSNNFALFGVSVSLEGDYAAIGADSEDVPVQNSGAAYVFVRGDNGTPADPSDDTWTQRDRVTAGDFGTNQFFGRSVAMNGNWLLVGAYGDDELGTVAGAAYFFRKLDGGTPGDPSDDTWVQHQKVQGSDTAAADQFGVGVATDGDAAIVGALNHDGVAQNSGAAYVFDRDDNGTPGDLTDDTWSEIAKLAPSDGAAFDLFGRYVSIDGVDIVVGAPQADGAASDTGAAYYYRRDDNGTPGIPGDDTWINRAKLVASDGATEDEFGYSVSVQGGLSAIGAHHRDNGGADAGAVYVFDLAGGDDCNSNGVNDACEDDCNGSGSPDDCDISGGTSQDCNLNGVPDDCELTDNDCNANMVPDDCDIAGATSDDCNSNALPDECELAENDCNTNGLIDACETADGLADDCNTNGVPDECETLEAGIDGDGDIDLADFAPFQACFSGPGPVALPAECCIYDFDDDADVDIDDWALFEAAVTGPL